MNSKKVYICEQLSPGRQQENISIENSVVGGTADHFLTENRFDMNRIHSMQF